MFTVLFGFVQRRKNMYQNTARKAVSLAFPEAGYTGFLKKRRKEKPVLLKCPI